MKKFTHKEYCKKYYLTHKKESVERSKKYRILNKDTISEKSKEYRLSHKDEIKIQRRGKYLENKKERDAISRAYYASHKDEIKINNRKNYIKNRDRNLAYRKQYVASHKSEIKERHAEYYKEKNTELLAQKKGYFQRKKKEIYASRTEKRKADPVSKLAKVLRGRLTDAIKGNYKKGSAVHDLGCTIPELKMYLEGQFTDGMTWENWSFRGWHIDHKIPLAFFDLTDREQLLKAVHYSNLQPLWMKENFKKGARLIWQ